ncbi:MAG: hypothetical protein ACI8S6_000858 [Myxococcota bacterium]|jgi:hypothetical protein
MRLPCDRRPARSFFSHRAGRRPGWVTCPKRQPQVLLKKAPLLDALRARLLMPDDDLAVQMELLKQRQAEPG